MCKNISPTSKAWQAAMLCVLLMLAAAHAAAQTSDGNAPPAAQPSPTPQAQPSPSLESRFFANILHDQRAIWTAPFHYRRADARWLAPLGLSTAFLLATDRHTAGEMLEGGPNLSRLRISRDISQGGALYTTGGIAATFYLIGRVGHNARARETGLLGAEALIDSGIFVQALKVATQRPRPLVDDASGEFFDRGNSFPSGHAISAWSLATVIAHEYGQHRPLVRFGVYGLASAVSLSRYTGRKHFLSDVLVGSAAGYGIGRYVYRAHHDPALDTGDDNQTKTKTHSKLLPFVAPHFSRATRTYGLMLAWEL
jgi:membrane-associated phospholipid phosphatase